MKITIITPTIETITTNATKEDVINNKSIYSNIINFKDFPEVAEKPKFLFLLSNLFYQSF